MGNCPVCGASARPQARFCSKCGSPLVTGAGITPPPPLPSQQNMRQPTGPVQSGPLAAPLSELEVMQTVSETQAQAEAPPAEEEREETIARGEVEAEAASTPALSTVQTETLPLSLDGGTDTGGTDAAVAEKEVPLAAMPAQPLIPAVEAASGEESATAPVQPPVLTMEAVSGEERVEDRRPLVAGRSAVVEQRFVIAEKLLACVPFAQSEHRERNKNAIERLIRLSLPIGDTAWGQMAYIAGIYGSLMGGNVLNTEQKLELWQALLWAVQYEYSFRQQQFVERFSRIAVFLHMCNADKAFQAIAFKDLEIILPQFDKSHLKSAREAIEKHPSSQAITSLKQLLDRSIEREDPRPIIAALERLWNRLDRSREKQNRDTIEEARQDGLTSAVTARLVVMSVFVCKNFLEHAPSPANGAFDEELQAALTLSAFASRCATGSYIPEAQKCDTALKALQEGRAGRSERVEQSSPPGVPPTPVSSPPGKTTSASPPAREQQNGNAETASDRRQRTIADRQEEPRRRLEAIFGPDILPGLLENMRNFRLDLMRPILRRSRAQLLSALSEMLGALPFLDELLPPRSAFYVRGNVQSESFSDLKKRLLGSGEESKRRALAQLEQMERDALERETVLAHEWVLFARAVVLGLDKALPEWREHYHAGAASAEEVWNLAVIAVRSGDRAQALEMLRPGVAARATSVAHLCLALRCGLDILLRAEQYPRVAGMATAFLLDSLPLLPAPESYLLWLSLAAEAQDAPDSNRQSDMIGHFLGFLERPLQLLLTERGVAEVSIEAFEGEYRELLATIRQLEDRYRLELHNGNITIQSKLVRSFLHPAQPKRSRVGLFVDYENLRPWLPVELQERPEEVGVILTRHAAQYGEVVCRWICAAPRNIPDSATMVRQFEDAGFRVQFPRGRTGQLSPTENLTDFVLVECIVFEETHSQPDVYVIVSGDGDYFERISRLIEKGSSVHIVACRSNLSQRYVRQADRYAQGQFPEGHGGLFIDYLEEILSSRANKLPQGPI